MFPDSHHYKLLKLIEAIREAATGSIVILGITPDRPETGYGYGCIRTSASLRGGAEAIQTVKRFVEKSDATTAQTFLEQCQ